MAATACSSSDNWGESAVDVDRSARDVRGGVACEEEREIGEFLGVAHSSGGNAASYLRDELLERLAVVGRFPFCLPLIGDK